MVSMVLFHLFSKVHKDTSALTASWPTLPSCGSPGLTATPAGTPSPDCRDGNVSVAARASLTQQHQPEPAPQGKEREGELTEAALLQFTFRSNTVAMTSALWERGKRLLKRKPAETQIP